MSKLVLHEIGYRNFLSSGNQFTTITVDTHKTTLLCGQKGSGKTSVSDAICFTWFNKALRKISKTQLPNTINNKETETYTIFSIGTNRYKVLRGIKPNKLEITVNDEPLEIVSGKDPQEWLEELIGFSYKTLKHVVLLGNASLVPFMQMDAKERREVVEDLRELDIFSAMAKLAKEQTTVKTKEQSEVKSDVAVLTNKTSMLRTFITDTESNTTSQIESINQDIQKELSVIESKRATRSQLIDNGKTLAATIICDPEAIKSELDGLVSQRNQAESKKQRYEKTLDEFSALVDCPTCYQKVDSTHKHDIQEKVDNSILKLSGGLALIANEITALQEKVKHNQNVNNQLDLLRAEVKDVNQDIKICESHIEKYNSMIEKIQNSTQMIDGKKSELELAEKDLSVKQTLLDDVTIEINTLLECQKHLKDDGIKASLIEAFIPLFNSLVNKYLDKLDFFVRFELDGEFNEVIKSRHRDTFSYYSFSEGEKATIDMALLFAWREITMMSGNALTNFMVLDEVIDSSLDDSATSSMLDILEEMDCHTIVISHKARELFQNFERIIEFSKIKNFSVSKDITNE